MIKKLKIKFIEKLIIKYRFKKENLNKKILNYENLHKEHGCYDADIDMYKFLLTNTSRNILSLEDILEDIKMNFI